MAKPTTDALTNVIKFPVNGTAGVRAAARGQAPDWYGHFALALFKTRIALQITQLAAHPSRQCKSNSTRPKRSPRV